MSKKPTKPANPKKLYSNRDPSRLDWLDGATGIITPIRPGAKGPGRKPKNKPRQDKVEQGKEERK